MSAQGKERGETFGELRRLTEAVAGELRLTYLDPALPDLGAVEAAFFKSLAVVVDALTLKDKGER